MESATSGEMSNFTLFRILIQLGIGYLGAMSLAYIGLIYPNVPIVVYLATAVMIITGILAGFEYLYQGDSKTPEQEGNYMESVRPGAMP